MVSLCLSSVLFDGYSLSQNYCVLEDQSCAWHFHGNASVVARPYDDHQTLVGRDARTYFAAGQNCVDHRKGSFPGHESVEREDTS